MSQVIITQGAMQGLVRCRTFLDKKNTQVVCHASQIIERHLSRLETDPEIGRPHSDEYALRELIIPFGDSGYVALYRYEKHSNTVYVLAFRHQKEAGY